MEHSQVITEPGDHSVRFYGETLIFGFLFLVGLLTNGPLFLIYFRSKHIRTAVDKFLFNMLIADGLCVVILMPTILVDLVSPETSVEVDLSLQNLASTPSLPDTILIPPPSIIGIPEPTVLLLAGSTRPSWGCALKKSLLSGVSTASILASLEIAVERYLAVLNPLHYHEFVTKSGVLSTSAVGATIVIGSAILSSLDPCQPVFPGCVKNMSSLTDSIWWPAYTLLHVTFFFVLPILLITFIYVNIWWEARRQRAKMNSRPFFVDLPNYGSPAHPIQCPVEATRRAKRSYVHPILLRFKLIERLVAPRMDRAARVAVCTLCVSILCWGPYYFVETSHAIQSVLNGTTGNKGWNHYETILPLFFASLHPVIAPFFYAYRYKRVREEFLKVCGLDSCPHTSKCVGLTPRKSVVLDFHDMHLNSTTSMANQILTPVSSEIGIHINDAAPFDSPPASPKPLKFKIGSESDLEAEGTWSPSDSHPSLPTISDGLNKSQPSLSEKKVVTESASFASIFHCISAWITSYSHRWGNHRESVTSAASLTTLLNVPANTNKPITNV